MDYEKLYKEALERAKKIDIDNAYASQGTIAKTIFPELAENEGEKIRKWLVDYFKEVGKSWIHRDITCEQILEWLEKQKELPFVKDVVLGYPGHYFYDGERMHFCGPVMEEKQKEPHYTKRNELFDKCVENCDPEVMKEVSDNIDEMLQKEQHPSSRFLPGDWVVYDGPLGHAILQVKDVVDGRYTFVDNDSTLLEEDSDKFLRPLTQKDVERKEEWKPQPESLEALMYAIEGKWDAISPTSYLSRRLEDLYEGLVNTYNVDESLLAELPKATSRAYTAEDIEELRELKRKIEASMEQKSAEKQDYSGLNDLERAIHRGFLSTGVANVPVTIIKETAKECLAQMKPAAWGEEDEKMRRNLMSLLANLRGNGIKEETYQKYYPWLKFLRPSWKPSEEQLDALDKAIPVCMGVVGRDEVAPLESLYEQLKRLM